jgi:hypothetical protein
VKVLAEFAEGGGQGWPPQPEFAAMGQVGLYKAVTSGRGTVYWAERLGVRLRPGQDRRSLDEAEALAEAREVVAELGVLPSIPRLRAMGRFKLAAYLRRTTGNASDFARAHSLPARLPGRSMKRSSE